MSSLVGLQLYSVREDAERDFAGTLKKVSEAGYKGVEFAGYGGLSAVEMKKLLDSLGLAACGTHVGIDRLRNNLDEEIEYNLAIGNKYILCPWADYECKQDFLDMAEFLNEVGKKCREKGIVFGYHNHAHEFAFFDGVYGLDILLQNSDPENVIWEIDTYWVQYAGLDPAEYIKKYSGRCRLIHIKDMEGEGEDRHSTVVGTGKLDWNKIADTALENGADWFIVEQEAFKKEPIIEVAEGFENLKKLGIA